MINGIYVLLIELTRSQKIRIGRLGILEFTKGLYAYVGSAQNGLKHRINRHKSRAKKRFWHIDYLLEKGKIIEVYSKEAKKRVECETAKELEKKFKAIPGFGCSDCRCRSHLFFMG